MKVFRNAQIWLPGYVRYHLHRDEPLAEGVKHILFSVADHYEPSHGKARSDIAARRVQVWRERFPKMAMGLHDGDGKPPQHTFFFPAEQYLPEHVEILSELCRGGYGEVEVHIHHHQDTEQNLRRQLEQFKIQLAGHGLLSRDRRNAEIVYTFVHGNWALANPHEDGRWCGVQNELAVLEQTGCIADFTFPAAPNDAQPRRVNGIYYVRGVRQGHHRPYDDGVSAAVGVHPQGLLMIQGPISIDWRRRKWGILPRLDRCSIHHGAEPLIERFRLWVRQNVHVSGRPEWIFIKAHTHGAVEDTAAMFLGEEMSRFHAAILREFNDGERYQIHYVTAREMVNIVKAAEDGKTGNPGQYRDYRYLKNWSQYQPPNRPGAAPGPIELV